MTIKEELRSCAVLSDEELWSAMPRFVRGGRAQLVSFLIHLMEIKRRELHVERAYPGLYTYLVKLGFSEWESHARTIAVRVARKYRSVLGLLKAGRLSLSTLALVGPHLNPDNYRYLLRKVSRRSKREVEILVATFSPRLSRRDVVRILSVPSPLPDAQVSNMQIGEAIAKEDLKGIFLSSLGTQTPSGDVKQSQKSAEDLFPQFGVATGKERSSAESLRLRFSFDGSEELDRLIKRARELLFHKYPGGGMEFILLDALDALLDKIDPERRFARQLRRQSRRVSQESGQDNPADGPKGLERPGPMGSERPLRLTV